MKKKNSQLTEESYLTILAGVNINQINKNNRKYTKKSIKNAIDKIPKKGIPITVGQSTKYIDNNGEVKMDKIAGMLKKEDITIKDDKVYIKYNDTNFLNTKQGKIAKNLIEKIKNGNLRFAPCGFGTLEEKNGVYEVLSDYQLSSIDILPNDEVTG